MKKLEAIKCTRVQPRFTRKHQDTMSRVKKTIAKLRDHYGDGNLIPNQLDFRSELSGLRSGGTPDRLMRIAQDGDIDDGKQFAQSMFLDRERGIMTHHGFRITSRKDRVRSSIMTREQDAFLSLK